MEDNKVKFFEMLGSITEVAKAQNNKISQSEVIQLFGDLELTEEQQGHVSAYLLASGIDVEGASKEAMSHVKSYQSTKSVEEDEENTEDDKSEEGTEVEGSTDGYMDEDKLEASEGDIYGEKEKIVDAKSIQEEKDSMYLKMYLEDLSAIKPLTKEEEEKLFAEVKVNNGDSVSRLIEGYLIHVVEVAKQYSYSGVLVEDLIGEGNIGLMSGVGSLAEINHWTEMKEHLEQAVRNGILTFLDEEVDLGDLGRRVIERANYLNSASNELAEDMGRDPSIEELSAYTKLSVEDIKDVLHISGDNIKVKKEHSHHEHKHN